MTLQDQLSKIGNHFICPAAIIVQNEKILLGMRHYTSVPVWTTPGGKCDEGESLEIALRREVQEEVNITDLKIFDFIGEVPGAKEGYTVPIFFCTSEQDPQLMEPEKFSEWRWVPVEEYLKGEPYSTMNPAAHKLISGYLKQRPI